MKIYFFTLLISIASFASATVQAGTRFKPIGTSPFYSDAVRGNENQSFDLSVQRVPAQNSRQYHWAVEGRKKGIGNKSWTFMCKDHCILEQLAGNVLIVMDEAVVQRGVIKGYLSVFGLDAESGKVIWRHDNFGRLQHGHAVFAKMNGTEAVGFAIRQTSSNPIQAAYRFVGAKTGKTILTSYFKKDTFPLRTKVLENGIAYNLQVSTRPGGNDQRYFRLDDFGGKAKWEFKMGSVAKPLVAEFIVSELPGKRLLMQIKPFSNSNPDLDYQLRVFNEESGEVLRLLPKVNSYAIVGKSILMAPEDDGAWLESRNSKTLDIEWQVDKPARLECDYLDSLTALGPYAIGNCAGKSLLLFDLKTGVALDQQFPFGYDEIADPQNIDTQKLRFDAMITKNEGDAVYFKVVHVDVAQ